MTGPIPGLFVRMVIALAAGEVAPTVGYADLPPPHGFRWESDAELRARITETLDLPPPTAERENDG